MNKPVISDREQCLLKHLVELYIRDGQPIGSKTLAHEAFSTLSPASVRKVLCDLEEKGYLTSPHTSAGRLPTAQGIRFFVDSLLSVHPLNITEVKRVEAQLEQPHRSVDHLISQASTVLSEVTHMVGIVTLPQCEDYMLAGQQNLFANPLTSFQKLQKLFEAFTQKQEILHLLDRCLQSDRVQMFIGEESGYDAFREYSVITSRYHVDGETVGVLGVIGPTRMPYDKVIPVVELTAKILGTLLNPEKASPSI